MSDLIRIHSRIGVQVRQDSGTGDPFLLEALEQRLST